MKRFIFAPLILLISLSFSFTACGNSYERMIEEFDGKYLVKEYLPPAPYTTSSETFEEDKMLDEVILMAENQLYIFTAPDGGEDCIYEWKGFVLQKDSNGDEKKVQVKIPDSDKRTLSFLAPGNFNRDKGNLLVVTVTEKSGRQFTDTATVFIKIE